VPAVWNTSGWRSVRLGVLAALGALTALVAALGPALTLIPIGVLRLVVGFLLLVFGMQWLRKAILRASGFVPLHDEAAVFEREMALAREAGPADRAGMDWYAFTLSFKGVFLEGTEVAFIVLTFGGTPGGIKLAAIGAAAAVLLVSATGVLVSRPLSRVPENTLKFAVGLMLTTFGVFWGGEGAGVDWPGADGALVAILAFLTVCSLILVTLLSRYRRQQVAVAALRGG